MLELLYRNEAYTTYVVEQKKYIFFWKWEQIRRTVLDLFSFSNNSTRFFLCACFILFCISSKEFLTIESYQNSLCQNIDMFIENNRLFNNRCYHSNCSLLNKTNAWNKINCFQNFNLILFIFITLCSNTSLFEETIIWVPLILSKTLYIVHYVKLVIKN